MKYKSIQDRIIQKLPKTLQAIDLKFIEENTIKHALNRLIERGRVVKDGEIYRNK
jgi:hypothetical protein